ncbi:MAG: hypothetical protein FWF45_04585 [Coriobacteriia bacterium]|nr:hypothetical protein [Coriobacteriia bacterium]
MLTEMAKVRIIGVKASFDQTFEALYSFGKLQFDDLRPKIEKGELPIKSMQLPEGGEEQKEKLTTLAQRSRVLCAALKIDENSHVSQGMENPMLKAPTEELIQTAEEMVGGDTDEFVGELESETAALVKKSEDLEAELAELEKYKPIMAKVLPVVKQLTAGDVEGLDSTALLVEERYMAVFGQLEKELRACSDDRTRVVAAAQSDDGIVPMVVVFGRDYARPIRNYLRKEKATQIKLPDQFAKLSLDDALAQLEVRSEELVKEIAETKEALDTLAEGKKDQLLCIKDAIDDRIEEFEVLVQFGETAYTFVIEGYVPQRDYDELVQAIPAVGENVVLEQQPIEPHDYPDVPVEIAPRKGILSGFRSAIGLWGSPEYGTLDPTIILSISFPIIFGMIVGDAGYGLLMIIACLIMRMKMPKSIGVQNITGVLMPAGIATTIFGVFYFEFFGNLAHEYIPGLDAIKPIRIGSSFTFPFLRTESNLMTTLLFMAIGLGIFEMMVGLVFGMINGKKLGHTKHVIEKGGILLVLVAGILLAVTMAMPALTSSLGATGASVVRYVAYLLLALGLVSALFGGGIMGAIEVLESLTHSASYIRIMAVGLVGALLADAANDLAFHTMPNIGGVAIALVLHILNFAIIVFSPSIHALRLNFLEFFGNFFERGTKEYKPFVRAGKEGKS